MIQKIIEILSEWDPIDVGYPLSLDEYSSYAPKIAKLIDNEAELRSYIVSMLNIMGVLYDNKNSIQKDSIDMVVLKFLTLK